MNAIEIGWEARTVLCTVERWTYVDQAYKSMQYWITDTVYYV